MGYSEDSGWDDFSDLCDAFEHASYEDAFAIVCDEDEIIFDSCN